jgi:hypothetical protein
MFPWAAAMVSEKRRKEIGDTRLCVDFRKLNTITKKHSFALPRIDDVLDLLQGQKFFSTLYLVPGYWQIDIYRRRLWTINHMNGIVWHLF